MNHPRLKLYLAAASCTLLTAALTGCGLGTGAAAKSTTGTAAARLLTGNVHGGQQAVSGSTVKMWAAGVSGTYGTLPTLIATTTSDNNGNFGFDNTAGVSPCTTGQYLYLTAQGGNSGSGTNSMLAMMAALPNPCSATTGSQFVTMNEITTVAAVTALQQFMTISPTAAIPWTVGAPSTNVTGLANAFLTTGTLASSFFGTTATSSTSNAVTSIVGGQTYTTTVNPDFTKINTLADILAACINTAGGNTCNSLFSDTTPGTSTAPTDTIQAMYYLATNSAGLTMPAHGSTASPVYLCNTYVTASAPFQPTIACSTATATTPVPSDWAIGVSYHTVNATASTVATATPASVAIDAAGNIWTAANSTSATGGSIAALNVLGQVVVAPVSTANLSTTGGWDGSGYTGTTAGQAFGGARPNSIAIDTNGNSWTGAYYTTSVLNTGNTTVATGGTNEAPIIQVTPAGVATGYLVGTSPGALVIDGSNNIYMSDIPTIGSGVTTSRYYVSELAAAGTTTSTAAYSNFYTGIGRGTGIYGELTVDGSTNQYVTPVASSACGTSLLQTNNTIESGNTGLASTNAGVNTIVLSTTTCIETGVAADAKSNLWGANSTYLEYIDTSSTGATAAAPYVTQFASGTGTTQGGLDAPNDLAIDGLGNVWVANRPSTTTGGVSEFTPTTTTAGVTTVAAKSPVGVAIYGFGSTYGYSGPVGVAIDGSGNVWVATSGGSTALPNAYLNFLVGVAAPVVTPNALAVKNAKIGVRP